MRDRARVDRSGRTTAILLDLCPGVGDHAGEVAGEHEFAVVSDFSDVGAWALSRGGAGGRVWSTAGYTGAALMVRKTHSTVLRGVRVDGNRLWTGGKRLKMKNHEGVAEVGGRRFALRV